MNSLWTGSTWLITTASALSPLIALLIGFAGTDRLLRWQIAVTRDPHSGEGRGKSLATARVSPLHSRLGRSRLGLPSATCWDREFADSSLEGAGFRTLDPPS